MINLDLILHSMSEDDKTDIIYSIWNTLYPDGDMSHEWSSDELETIAGILKDAGLGGGDNSI